ncbi:hypothetical protein ABBQ32_001736 [Trebouxia sp. C0010 RCD-2024]
MWPLATGSTLSCLLICLYCTSSQAVLHNETAVSQTYESVHLSEAARKSKDGKGSLEDVLHWAIENSDPEQLKQQAETVGREDVGLTARQQEVQQLIRDMQAAPTEIDLIKDTIDVLTNSSAPPEEMLMALEALQSLVEPIDNANDLHTLRGLHPIVRLLSHDSPSLQAAAAFVLGTAASNNNKFQEQLMQLHPESISLLLQVTSSSSAQTSKKGLYALAALLRNNADARALFYSNQGVQHLISLLKAPNQTEQVSLKVLNLVTDLSQLDLGKKVTAKDRQKLLAAVHPHACHETSSNREEALMAVRGILECSDTEAQQIAHNSGASTALQKDAIAPGGDAGLAR